MKRLDEYDTPETDEFYSPTGYRTDEDSHEFARRLEQRLAACRDALACINSSQILPDAVHSLITETLTITAPK